MRRIPWRRSRVEIIRRSFWPSRKPLAFEPLCRRQSHSEGNGGHLLLPFPSNLSKHAISLMATVNTPRPLSINFSSPKCFSSLNSPGLLPFHFYLQSVEIVLLPFHSNPSCNLKNSRNAGSSFKLANSLGCAAPSSAPPAPITDRRLSAAAVDMDDDDEGVEFLDLEGEMQICASSPSSCRSPFLILMPSKEER